jgi:signal transduction histidine kinase
MGLLLLLVVASVGVIAFFAAEERVNEVYDGQLIIGANVLRALMAEELHELPPEKGERQLEVDDSVLLSPEDRRAFNDYAEWRMFRVWRHGRVVMRSDTGPPSISPPAEDGFSELRTPGGDPWRVYSLRVANTSVVVQVGERAAIRLALIRRIALAAAVPLLLFIPMAAALIWLSLHNGLSALRLLMAEIGRRSMRDLSSLRLDPWPRDLHPLIRAINRLFSRIERALQHERRFLDSAAHQLRTPLAAVKLQAQLIAKETDPAERLELIRRLTESVDRASSMTNDLLTLARLEAQPQGRDGPAGDLRTETVAAIADLAPLAARREIGFSFEGPPSAPAGDPMLLRLVAANLIENALNHAPAHSEIEVRIIDDSAGLTLGVSDTGPGIPSSERERVVERFYRSPLGGRSGTGLGLSIVSEAVRLLGGRLVLSDRPDGAAGLCATVRLSRQAES